MVFPSSSSRVRQSIIIARLESAAIFLNAAKSGRSRFPKTAPITSHRPPGARASGSPAIKRRTISSPSPPPSANLGYRTPGRHRHEGRIAGNQVEASPRHRAEKIADDQFHLVRQSIHSGVDPEQLRGQRLDLNCGYPRRGPGAYQRLRPDAGTQVQHAALRPSKHAAELDRVIPVVELCRGRHLFAEQPQSAVEHQPVRRRDPVPDPIHQAERFDRREQFVRHARFEVAPLNVLALAEQTRQNLESLRNLRGLDSPDRGSTLDPIPPPPAGSSTGLARAVVRL